MSTTLEELFASKATIFKEDTCLIRHIKYNSPLATKGHYCAYVVLDSDHPFYGKDYDDLDDFPCHCGLTFSEQIEDKWILGWDYGHFDSPKFETSEEAITYILNEPIIKLVRSTSKEELLTFLLDDNKETRIMAEYRLKQLESVGV